MTAYDPKRTLASSFLNNYQTQSVFVMTDSFLFSSEQQSPKPI